MDATVGQARFDDLDVSILAELSEDGRKPFTRIATQLGVTEATIRSRVRRLLRGKAIRFVTEVDPHQMGLLSAFLLLRISSRDPARAVKSVCDIPEAIYVLPCVGSADIIAQVVCSSPQDLSRLCDEWFHGSGVELVQTLVTSSMAKVRYSFTAMSPGGKPSGRKSQRQAQGS